MDLRSLTSLIDLSENIKMTQEGYLLCCDVCLTVVGELLYSKEEYPQPDYVPNVDGMIKIVRSIDSLDNIETIGSFAGKPVTFNHPQEQVVTVETWKDYAVGTIMNPRFNGNGVIADLLITDKDVIDLITSKTIRQVSSGITYVPHFVEDGICLATKIQCNHVALVREGRAGDACIINDSKRGVKMGGLKEKLMRLLTMFGEHVSEMPDDDEKANDAADNEDSKEVKKKAVEEAKATDADEEIDEDEDMANDKAKAMDAKFVSKDEFQESMSKLETLLKEALPKQEAKQETANDAAMCDEQTLSKAEILAPGIKAQANIKRVALDEAMKTEDGKEVILSIAADGVNEKNVDTVFNAAYLVLKERRSKSVFNSLNDAAPGAQNKDYFSMTAVNEMNSKFWSNKGVK